MKFSLAMCLPTPMPFANEYPRIMNLCEPLTVWVTDRELEGEVKEVEVGVVVEGGYRDIVNGLGNGN